MSYDDRSNDGDNLRFIDGWGAISGRIHETAKEKGWWDNPRNEGEIIALIHSELSEGLEALRKDLMDDKLTHRKGIEVELADAVIRIMDYAEAFNYDVEGAILEKIDFNTTREKMHGGKKF